VGGVDDGLVTGAAAQVARQRVGDLGTARLRQGVHKPGQAHDDARRAEAALAAVAVHHGLLHRVQRTVGLFQAFNGLDRFAVQRGQQLQATVDGKIVHARTGCIELPDKNHAGAAVALGTALFGPTAPQLFAQVVQNGRGPAFAGSLDDRAVKHETHGVGGLGHWIGDEWGESAILFLRSALMTQLARPTRRAAQEPRYVA
jgi:hypothetical protein